MGCDIHLFIEITGPVGMAAWASGQIDITRDRRLFSLLAGVHSDVPPLIPPRGLPPQVSAEVFEHYYYFVADEDFALRNRGLSCVTPSEAEALLASGKSHQPPGGFLKYGVTSPRGFVSNPDWHSASWLWFDEIKRIVPQDVMASNPSFQVVLETLRSLEELIGRARIVFSFDN